MTLAMFSTDQEGVSVYSQQVEVHTILSFEGLHRYPHTALNISLVRKNPVCENELLLQNLQ